MQYWNDWDNSCIVFGEIVKTYINPKYVKFKDLTGAEYPMVPTKEIYNSLEEAVNALTNHYVKKV